MTTQTQQTTAVQTAKREMSFVPYGGGDTIRLSVEIVKNLIAVPTKSGKTCSDRDAMKFMMMCQAKRLNPFEGDAFLIGYDGQSGPEFSLITAHQAFLKRAELHPEYDGMRSGIIVETGDGQLVDFEGDFYRDGDNVIGGWATVYFKSRKYPCSRRIRMERFNKGFAQWKVDAAGMICKCAEADALRSSFPTMLGGLYMREEVDANAFGISVEVQPGRKPNLELVETSPAPLDNQSRAREHLAAMQPAEVKPEPLASTQSSVEKRGPGRPRKLTPEEEAIANRTSVDAAPEQASPPQSLTPQQSLDIYLDSAGVSWSDLRGFLVSDGHYPDADSATTIHDLPAEVCRKLAADAKAMSKLVKLYGGGKESVTP